MMDEDARLRDIFRLAGPVLQTDGRWGRRNTPRSVTVLIVDDEAENLRVLGELLRPQYRVFAATSGAGCMRVANSLPKPDLIPLSGPEDEEPGLGLGGADYIRKSIKPLWVLARVRPQREAKQAHDGLHNQNAAQGRKRLPGARPSMTSSLEVS